jgi:BirA family biotin operon repressor/biotin-[acetyl-CoA-carboxylase] ligase
VLLRPKTAISDPVQLAQQTAQIVATTIQSEFHLSATVKLPNDIYIGNRKVAGVLVEMRAQPKAPHLAVLGVGVNVNQMPHDFSEELRERAISLVIARRGPVDRTSFAVALLRNLDLLYRAAHLR